MINQAGIDLIKSFEQLRLSVYNDQAGNETIGYGHMITDDDDIGDTITQEQADSLLQKDLENACGIIQRLVTVPLTGNQFSGLGSLVFNTGAAPLTEGLGQALNAGDYQGCADHFLLWDKVTIDGVLQKSQGLLNRRIAERTLFLTKDLT